MHTPMKECRKYAKMTEKTMAKTSQDDRKTAENG